uniref:Retrotransposon Copia-like N-terminal domain-containing protein n=1 Tax=Solanum tuberosum TaxID=4113 RepID=M1C2H2_SOLTU
MAQEKESIDSTNPLYMHPSESVGSGITPGTLNGSGYRSWRRAVLGESNEALDNHLDEPCTLRTYGNLTLTKEQQTQLLHLLGSFQSGSPCTSSDNITSGAANFVAILACSTHSEVIDNLSDKCSHSPTDF